MNHIVLNMWMTCPEEKVIIKTAAYLGWKCLCLLGKVLSMDSQICMDSHSVCTATKWRNYNYFSHFYRWRNLAIERLSNLSQVILLIRVYILTTTLFLFSNFLIWQHVEIEENLGISACGPGHPNPQQPHKKYLTCNGRQMVLLPLLILSLRQVYRSNIFVI